MRQSPVIQVLQAYKNHLERKARIMMRTIRDLITRTSRKHSVASILVLCVLAFFSSSCASTRITDVWKAEDYQGKAEKIVVIMAAKEAESRKLFEDRFVAVLRARGNNAMQSYQIISLEQLPDRELVKAKITESGADTVLISRLVNLKTIESYVPGQRYVVPNAYYGWGPYYTVVLADYGHTADTRVVYIETNLYNIQTEKLIWSAHSRTERTEGQQQLIKAFADIMTNKLASDRIIR